MLKSMASLLTVCRATPGHPGYRHALSAKHDDHRRQSEKEAHPDVDGPKVAWGSHLDRGFGVRR
jgi:hypothetical protein